jgi:hypothetical protein
MTADERFRTQRDLIGIVTAKELLRNARNHLKRSRAKRAAQYVARALKSVEGAERHAQGRLR